MGWWSDLLDSFIGFFTGQESLTAEEQLMLNQLKKLRQSLNDELDSAAKEVNANSDEVKDITKLSSDICKILKVQNKVYENGGLLDTKNAGVMTNKMTVIKSSLGEVLSCQDDLKRQQEVILKLQEEMVKLKKARGGDMGGACASGYHGFYPPQPGYMGYHPPYPIIPPCPVPVYDQFPPQFPYNRPFYEDNLLRHQQRSFSGSSYSIASSIESSIPTNFRKYEDEENRREETMPKLSKKLDKCTDCCKTLGSESEVSLTENNDSHCENCVEGSGSGGRMYFDAVGYMKKRGMKKPVLEEIMDVNVRLDVEEPKNEENKGKTYLPRRNPRSVSDASEVRSNIGDDLEENLPYEQNYRYTENWLRNNDQEIGQFEGATYDGKNYRTYNSGRGNFYQRGHHQSGGFRGDEEQMRFNRGGRHRQDNYHHSIEDNLRGNHRGRQNYSDHRVDNFSGNHQGGRMYNQPEYRDDNFRGNHRGRRMHSEYTEKYQHNDQQLFNSFERNDDTKSSGNEENGIKGSRPAYTQDSLSIPKKKNKPKNKKPSGNRFERNDAKSLVKEDELEGSIVPGLESLSVSKKGKKKSRGTNPRQTEDVYMSWVPGNPEQDQQSALSNF